jgi:hypothetical protein
MTKESELEKARQLFGQGNRDEARRILINAIRNDPRNPDFWFGLSFCVDDPQQKKDCLEKTLRLSPTHSKAKVLLEQLLIGEEDLNETPVITTKKEPVKSESTINVVLPTSAMPLASPDQTLEQQLDRGLIDKIEGGKAETQFSKKAGESTFSIAKKWRRIGIISGIFLIIVLIAFMVIFQLNKTIFHNMNLVIPLFCGFIIVGIFTVIIINKLADRWQNYRHGAIAEEFVGKILENLSQDYLVLNDIQLGYGNIDHFVIGKNGCLYMIETKSHRGKVAIEGDNLRINNKRTEKDFIKQTQRNSFDVRDEIASILGVNLNVTPVLVFTNAYVPFRANIKGVFIMNKKTLLKFILSGKEQQNHEVIWKKRKLIREFLYRPRW